MFPKALATEFHSASVALVAALSVGLVLNLGAFIFSLRILAPGTREHTFLANDRPRELPIKIRTIQAAFDDDPSHYGMEGITATAEWNAIRPDGMGFAFLGEENFPFDISMWHQIRCLNHIRAALVNGDDGSDYTEHCFHYIRQAILCAADTTLELGSNTRLPKGDRIAIGSGTVHTCRDWKQVYDWMQNKNKQWTPDMYERLEESIV